MHRVRLTQGERPCKGGRPPDQWRVPDSSARDTGRAMSQENVELVRRVNNAFNRGDFEAWLANADPDVRIRSSFTGQEYHGLEGAREWWREVRGAFSDFQIEHEELRDVGDFVLVRAAIRGHGTDSSAPFDTTAWMVMEFRKGKCVASLNFLSEADALEAAGLRE
jgi:ketosteroid isomerase-like protein